MPRTATTYNQDTPQPDGQIFVGASEFVDIAGLATVQNPALGNFSFALGATHACTFAANVREILRTGVLATFSGPGQQAFGTAASVPGPSSVANTSGPSGIVGYPPIPAASLPTLYGPQKVTKGLQVNSIDVIYSFTTNNGTLATVGVTQAKFVNATALATVALLAIANNGLSLVAAATPYVKNIAMTTIKMITDPDSELIVNVNLTSGAGGGTFYGVVLHVSYNLN